MGESLVRESFDSVRDGRNGTRMKKCIPFVSSVESIRSGVLNPGNIARSSNCSADCPRTTYAALCASDLARARTARCELNAAKRPSMLLAYR